MHLTILSDAVVRFAASGQYTFFGKAAKLIGTVQTRDRFQRIVLRITFGLMAFSLVLVVVIFVSTASLLDIQLHRAILAP